MEVSKSYIEFLLQLLNNEENIDIEEYKEELIVNLYLTLLSLSNLEYTDDISKKEQLEISDFLRRLNNLKVKIQLKRKPSETTAFAKSLIDKYYEKVNVLSIYIKDGLELEETINTMDTQKLTNLIDNLTKEKMFKEENQEEYNNKRNELVKLLPINNYYIKNNELYVKNNETYFELSVSEFINAFDYLLNTDNYSQTYQNKTNQMAHDLITNNIINILLKNDIKSENLDQILIPMILTYTLSFDITKNCDLDTSKFNIENIKINELYSLANQEQNQESISKTPKWRNISIPNEYLLQKLKEMITHGMYYFKDDSFILEHIDKNVSDFKISIKTEQIKPLLKTILESQ